MNVVQAARRQPGWLVENLLPVDTASRVCCNPIRLSDRFDDHPPAAGLPNSPSVGEEIHMSASTTATTSSTSVTTRVFWERLWRMSGINFVVFFIIAYVIYGSQPH